MVQIYTNWKSAIQSMVVTFIVLQRPRLSIFWNKFPRISKKVFSRTNSHAFLKYLAENKGRPPVLIIPLNISPSPHLLIFDLNIYLV